MKLEDIKPGYYTIKNGGPDILGHIGPDWNGQVRFNNGTKVADLLECGWTLTRLVPAEEVEVIKAIAESLAQALERLKALYESEQDGGDNNEFINRPDWLSGPLAAWRIAKGAEGLE